MQYSTVHYIIVHTAVQYSTVQCVQVTVERGDHIVPSFQEWAGRAQLQQGDTARRRWVGEDDISTLQWLLCCRPETGRAYYLAAMQSHGLPGKIPNSFTTGGETSANVFTYHVPRLFFCAAVGKPFFENIQYNSPIEVYNDETVVEMVKIMNTSVAAAK